MKNEEDISRLILMNGPPASGKTTLASILAQRLKLPLFSKDQLKELLFEILGWGEREWSRKLGAASSDLLFSIAESQIRAGQSCILESNFHAQSALKHLTRLEQHYDFRCIQILCMTDPDILMRRYNQRTLSGERHPGHGDELITATLADTLFDEPFPAIPYAGLLIEVDTNQPEMIDMNNLLRRINQ